MSTDTEILVQVTAETAQLQSGMEAGAATVASTTEAMAAAVEEAAAATAVATKAIGESADEAAVRIKAMVAASLEQQAVAGGIAESERSIAERMGQRIEMTQAQAAAIAETVAAQDAQMVSVEAYVGAEVEAAAATQAETAALAENTTAMAINGGVARELGVLTGEGLRGNWTRLEGSSITLANRMNLLQYAFSPIGLAAIAAGAALVGFGAEVIKGAEESNEFNKALAQTGGFLGVTEGQFNDQARAIQGAETTIGTAREAMLKLAQTGKFSGEAMETAGKAVVDFAALTGQSIDQAIASVVKIQESPVKALEKLNEQYHFLSLAQLEHIQKLQDEGDAVDAAKEGISIFQESQTKRLAVADENVGTLIRLWRELKGAISEAGDAAASAGRNATTEEALANARKQRATLMDSSYANPDQGGAGYRSAEENTQANAATIASWDKVISTLENVQKTEAKTSDIIAQRQKVQDAGIAAQPEIDSLKKLVKGEDAYTEALTRAKAALKAQHDANPNADSTKNVSFDSKGEATGGAGLEAIEAALHKKYDIKVKAHQSEHKLDEAELAKLEADESVSYSQRLKFELDFWQKKMVAATKGSAGYADAFRQVQNLQKELDRESAQEADKAAKEAQKAALLAAQSKVEIAISAAKSQLDIEKEKIETSFAMGQSSRKQELSQLAAAQNVEYASELDALKKYQSTLDQKTKAYADSVKQIEALEAGHRLAMQKSNDDMQKANLAAWKKYLAPINSAFQQSINGMIQGTQTLRQGINNILQSILGSYLNLGIEMVTDWTAKEFAKTTATNTAAAARAAAEQAQRTANTAADITTSVASVARAAGVAGALGTASFAGAPWPIDMGAPAFGLAMAATAASYGSIASAARGWERVPIDGAMTELHKDEMVLPAHVANPIRDMAKKGGQGGQGGGMTVNLSATHPRDFETMLRRDPRALVKALKYAGRMGHFGGAR